MQKPCQQCHFLSWVWRCREIFDRSLNVSVNSVRATIHGWRGSAVVWMWYTRGRMQNHHDRLLLEIVLNWDGGYPPNGYLIMIQIYVLIRSPRPTKYYFVPSGYGMNDIFRHFMYLVLFSHAGRAFLGCAESNRLHGPDQVLSS